MTEVLDPIATSPVREAVDDLRTTLTRLVASDLAAVTGDELLDLVGEMRAVSNQADALTLRLLHEVDARGVCVARGNTSTAAWLRWAHRLHPAEATRAVRIARSLYDDPAGPLVPLDEDTDRPRRQLRAAFAAGEISAEHVQVILDTLEKLPDASMPMPGSGPRPSCSTRQGCTTRRRLPISAGTCGTSSTLTPATTSRATTSRRSPSAPWTSVSATTARAMCAATSILS